jgi:hypothetical protein
MAEYIEREASINKFSDLLPIGRSIRQSIAEIPAADVVEVVRCKYCKHWLKDVAGCTDFVGRCEWANYMVGANGYCVYGEAKMDGKGEGE